METVAHAVLRSKAPSLARFADEDMDEVAILEYTSSVRAPAARCLRSPRSPSLAQVLGSASAASAAHQLGEGVQALEAALRTEVVSRHTELVQQVSGCVAQRSARRLAPYPLQPV